MKKRIYLSILIVLIPIGIMITRCTKTEDKVVDPYLIKQANTAIYGSYLTDKDGNTLYFFAKGYCVHLPLKLHICFAIALSV